MMNNLQQQGSSIGSNTAGMGINCTV